MKKKNQHYSSKYPDVDLKIHTVAASLRKHLYIFKTTTGVFSYKKLDLGTRIFIEHIYIPQEKRVLLDLGCGYGVIGIVLGNESPQSEVYMTDVNKRAIWCAKENVKYNLPNSRDRVHVITGPYFQPFAGKEISFDGVYINPPVRQGREDFLNLCDQLPYYLKKKGYFQFVMRKKMGAAYVLDYLKKHRPEDKITVICKRSGYWVIALQKLAQY
ncbi:MAG: methyltransferase [Candidatus Lokiarchaeota archaeon]|nr:methyltransferase [Candidatus Lokiarchaeota archaeon]MBD3340250.1 methyltransferase [Candidatus Lokiarchaeota archaeon]